MIYLMTEPDFLTIEVQLGAKDVCAATRMYFLNPVFVSIVSVVVLGAVLSAVELGPQQLYIAGSLLIFLYGILPLVQAVFTMRNPIFRNPIHHTFSETGISSKFQGGHIAVNWELIRRAKETRRHIAVWGKSGAPMMIPKHQLDAAKLASVREILRQHLRYRAKVDHVR